MKRFKIDRIDVNVIIGDQYFVSLHLGGGSFGQVFCVNDLNQSNNKYVVEKEEFKRVSFFKITCF